MDLDSAASRLKKFGPLNKFLPTLPNVRPGAGAKLDVLNQGFPGPIPRRICTGATKFGVCVLSGANSEAELRLNYNGRPEIRVRKLETCQSPRIAAPVP